MKKIVALTVLALAFAAQSQALTYLGFGALDNGHAANGGNDKQPEVATYLTFLGQETTGLSLLGKSDEGGVTGFSAALSTLHGLTSGSLSYAGLENISYLTFKVGNTQTAGQGYHLYSFMNGSFNLLTDPNPDFAAQGNTISHISVWTTTGNNPPPPPPPPASVPDSGATIVLLGGALIALAGFRSRKS